jgi:hypothetical protein
VRRRVAAGSWVPVHPRIFRLAVHPRSDASRAWAASLWVGAVGVLSGPAAANVYGWVTNLWIRGWAADVAFPEVRVAVELDGWAWHVERERFGERPDDVVTTLRRTGESGVITPCGAQPVFSAGLAPHPMITRSSETAHMSSPPLTARTEPVM